MKPLTLILPCLLVTMVTAQIYLLCDDFEFTTEDSCSCYNPYQPLISCPSARLHSIPNITKVHTLQLNGNNLTSLRANKLLHLNGLTKLEIVNNQIKRVSGLAFRGVESSLEWLDLSGNFLTAIPAVFGVNDNQQVNGSQMLTKLDVLKLSHNYIYAIRKEAFRGAPNLHSVFLDGNPINRISPDSWRGRVGLNHLALSVTNMDITTIPTYNLQSLMSLHVIGAKPMRLDFFSGWLGAFPVLQYLKLEGMGLEDDYLVKGSVPAGWRNQLLGLSLRGNKLTKIPYDLIGQLSLQELDLSANMIRRVSHISRYDNSLMKITKLNLDNNMITSLAAYFMFALPEARLVDLRNNYLTSVYWSVRQFTEKLHPESVLLLGGNKWKCNCGQKWLKEMIDKQLSWQNGHLSRDDIYSDLRCGPEPAAYSKALLVDVPHSAFCINT